MGRRGRSPIANQHRRVVEPHHRSPLARRPALNLERERTGRVGRPPSPFCTSLRLLRRKDRSFQNENVNSECPITTMASRMHHITMAALPGGWGAVGLEGPEGGRRAEGGAETAIRPRDAAGEGETLPFLARPLPFCQRLMPLLVVLQHVPPLTPSELSTGYVTFLTCYEAPTASI